MQISFFEEFPTKKNLDKLKLINFPTKLYLAAKSLKEFERLKSTITNGYVKKIIYWPILDKKEGYWISPFSKRSALKRVLNDVKNTPIMLDLELPTTQNPWLYITQFFDFFYNKRKIKQFINKHNKDVYLAEYYPCTKFKELILQFFGLHYKTIKVIENIKHFQNIPHVRYIKMAYHSMHNFNKEKFTALLRQGKKQFKDKYLVAFGTIAKGVQTNEPILSIKQLKEDLKIAKKVKVKEVIIFRLGGLNKEYVKAIMSV